MRLAALLLIALAGCGSAPPPATDAGTDYGEHTCYESDIRCFGPPIDCPCPN